MNIFLFVILVIVFLILLSLGIAGHSLAPWVPARAKDLSRIHKLIDAQPGEKVYEIGCGNGRVSLYMHDNSEADIIGIERAWPLALVSQIRKKMGKKDRFTVRHESCFKSDLSDADVVYTFGMPAQMKNKLAQKLIESCKSGTRIVSYVFKIDPWEPDVIDKPTKEDVPVYRYII